MDFIDVNIVDGRGDTPLIIAENIISSIILDIYLKKNDLDYKHCNNEGNDALSIMKKNNKSQNISFNLQLVKDKYLKELLSFETKNSWGSGWGSNRGSGFRFNFKLNS